MTTVSSFLRCVNLLLLSAVAFTGASAVQAQSAPSLAPAVTAASSPVRAMPRPTFLYVLRLPITLQQDSGWTDRERGLVGAHFQYLKAATEAGQVLLAGRTNEPLDKTFGLVIFEADDEAAARRFMEGDPAVQAGVMLATLHPYGVALKR